MVVHLLCMSCVVQVSSFLSSVLISCMSLGTSGLVCSHFLLSFFLLPLFFPHPSPPPSSSLLLLLLLQERLSLAWSSPNSRLAYQQAQGPTCLHTPCWDYRHTPPHLALCLWVWGDLNSGPHAYRLDTLLTVTPALLLGILMALA